MKENMKRKKNAHKQEKINDDNLNQSTNESRKDDADTLNGEKSDCPTSCHEYTMKEIGIISSPYHQRAGTPRQGLLAEHSRSFLTIHDGIAKECFDDLEQYSHVWVIFQFHLNPIGKGKDKTATRKLKKGKGQTQSKKNKSGTSRDSGYFEFTASKIRPPRANGKKVSVFATRSPHRPNNVGLSLARVEEVTTQSFVVGNKIRKKTIVKLLGLDLVDSTPVYDLKPVLPFDIVNINDLRVPNWVSAEDELSSVEWDNDAKQSIREFRKAGLLEPLYSSKVIERDVNGDSVDDDVIQAISEVVGQDPRASKEGRGDATNDSAAYEITFSQLRIKFRVESSSSTTGNNQARIVEVIKDEGELSLNS